MGEDKTARPASVASAGAVKFWEPLSPLFVIMENWMAEKSAMGNWDAAKELVVRIAIVVCQFLRRLLHAVVTDLSSRPKNVMTTTPPPVTAARPNVNQRLLFERRRPK